MPPTRTVTRKRTIHACSECRQAKVGCDSVTTFQHPCSRCSQRGLACTVDETFERTPVRQRIKAMSAELQQLRRSIKSSTEAAPTLTSASPVSENNANHKNGDSTDSMPAAVQTHSLPSITDALDPSLRLDRQDNAHIATTPATMGPLRLSVAQVEEHFKIYREYFAPYLPIMDLAADIGAIQKCSPFLFWTVIMIVRQRYYLSSEATLTRREGFVAQYCSTVNQWMLSSPLSLHDIQAILHLCVWPLPIKWQLSEPSVLYTGIAINACSYLNLSRSVNKHRYQGAQLSTQNADAMSRTWLATFSVSTVVALGIGTAPPIKHYGDLAGLPDHIKHLNAPPRLAAEAAIYLTLVKHHSLCANGADTVTHEALLDLHAKELDRIPEQHAKAWNDSLEIQRLSAKIHLYVPFLLKHSRVASRDADSARSVALSVGTAAACCLIEALNRLVTPASGPDQLPSPRLFVILPKSYFLALCHAICFLMRFGAIHVDQANVQEKVRQHITLASETLMMTALSSDDEQARAANVFGKMLRDSSNFEGQNVDIDEPERGSGSIFWDVLRQSYRLRYWKTNRTDLLNLIDPIRTVSGSDTDTNEAKDLVSAEIANPPLDGTNTESELWTGSMEDLCDLNLLDMSNSFDIDMWQAV